MDEKLRNDFCDKVSDIWHGSVMGSIEGVVNEIYYAGRAEGVRECREEVEKMFRVFKRWLKIIMSRFIRYGGKWNEGYTWALLELLKYESKILAALEGVKGDKNG